MERNMKIHGFHLLIQHVERLAVRIERREEEIGRLRKEVRDLKGDRTRSDAEVGRLEVENAELRQRVIDCKVRLGLPPDSGPLDGDRNCALHARDLAESQATRHEGFRGKLDEGGDRAPYEPYRGHEEDARRLVHERVEGLRKEVQDLSQRLEASRQVAEERQDVIRDLRRELGLVNRSRDQLRQERNQAQEDLKRADQLLEFARQDAQVWKDRCQAEWKRQELKS